MEVQESDVMGSNSERETHVIIKGKRTKRPRPASPLALTMASTTSSSTTTTAELSHGSDVDGGGVTTDNSGGFFRMEATVAVSPDSSIEFTKINVCTRGEKDEEDGDEEEDMANCLILLAQGRNAQTQQKPPHRAVPLPHNKAAAAAGSRGLYAYECKTCNRGFSSFQALGGHRASHKKPKPATLEEKKTIIALRKQDGHFEVCNTNNSTTPLSLQVSPNYKVSSCAINVNPSINKTNKKVHECSICGAEFTSGQALGGHMRRHRVLPMAPTITTTITTSDDLREAKRQKSLLSLDLNLPATEDDIGEPKSSFGSQDKVIVFSALPLVNFHL